MLLATGGGVQQLPQLDHVLQSVGHPGGGRLTVAARAAGLLIVGLDALGEVEMRDKPHVRLINAQTEGDGGDHNDTLFAQEALLIPVAHFRR